MREFLKMLVYGADGQPSLTSTLALMAFLLFVVVTLYLVVSGQEWGGYSFFASVTCGGGLLAQVTGKASALLTYELIAGCENENETSILLPDFYKPFGDLFLGLDIGRKKDLSVIWLWEKLGDVFQTRAVEEMLKMKFRDQKKVLYEYLKLPNLRRACIDCTGIGANLAEDAQLDFGKSRVEQVTFTAASKEQMAVRMHQIFEDRQARIPVAKNIRNDLHSVKKIVTAANNIRYDADRNENGHADRFWAAALGLHAGQMQFAPVEYTSVASRRFRKKGAY